MFEDVLQGDATLTVAGHAARSTFLPLEPLGLAIARATWEGETPRSGRAGSQPQTAALGCWSINPAG